MRGFAGTDARKEIIGETGGAGKGFLLVAGLGLQPQKLAGREADIAYSKTEDPSIS